MALIKCKECNKEISDKAETCPHCGNPISLDKKTLKEEASSKTVVRVGFGYPVKKEYRVRLLIFILMFFSGLIGIIISSKEAFGFWFLIGLVGFIGAIVTNIASWLDSP